MSGWELYAVRKQDGLRPLDEIDEMPGDELLAYVGHWASTVWVNERPPPTEADELAGFDLAALVPVFRDWIRTHTDRSWAARGVTLEEAWLINQLRDGRPLTCLLSTTAPDVPTGRLARLVLLEPPDLVDRIYQVAAGGHPGLVRAYLQSAEVGHVVAVQGVDPRTGWIRFADPDAGITPLFEGAGRVRIVPDPLMPDMWIVDPGDLRRLTVSIMLPTRTWQDLPAGGRRRAGVPAGLPPGLISLLQTAMQHESDQDFDQAVPVYEDILATGDPDYAPFGVLQMAMHTEFLGDLRRADAFYSLAIASGHGMWSYAARFHLGVSLAHRGAGGAEELFEQVAANGDPAYGPQAAHLLALARSERADWPGAEAAYRRVIDIGSDRQAARSALELAWVLEDLDRRPQAEGSYRVALERSGFAMGEPGVEAALGLARLYAESGRLPEARRLCRQVVSAGDPRFSAEAELLLGAFG